MLLPQDLYVIVKLTCLKSGWTFRSLSDQVFISTSQIHLGLQRAELAGLYSPKYRKIIKKRLSEFIIHGVKYVYPAERGGIIRGMPTSFAAPPLNSVIVATESSPIPVWPMPEGKKSGYELLPLHPAAPEAASIDPDFYEMLALIDCIREGRARERTLANKEIQHRLEKGDMDEPEK